MPAEEPAAISFRDWPWRKNCASAATTRFCSFPRNRSTPSRSRARRSSNPVRCPASAGPVFFRHAFSSSASISFSSWRECGQVYRDFQPTAVVGMGGFTSAIPLLLGPPSQITHPDSRIERHPRPRHSSYIAPLGEQNPARLREAAQIICASAHCVVTGTPVRRGLGRDRPRSRGGEVRPESSAAHYPRHGRKPGRARDQPTCPQGASASGTIDREVVQFIHLAGQADANIAEINYRRQRLTAVVQAFSTEMEHFYSLADVVISRSGAASLTELSHYGLPSVLVPYPGGG